MISVLITVPEKLRYQIKSLIYEAQEGFYKTFLVSPVPPPGFPIPAFFPGTWRRARGRRARGRQTDRTRDICPCQQTDGGRKAETWRETHFSLAPFHFPLADSKKLMTEQDERLWVAACVFCCPVRPGEGQEGGGAGFSFFLALASVTLAPIKNLQCAGSSISTLNCSVGLDFLFTAAVKGHAEERE